MNSITKTNDAKERQVEFVPFGAVDKIKMTIAIVQNTIAVKTKTGKTCSERDAMKFIMLCQAQRLNPFAGDAFLVGYDKRQSDGSYEPQFSLITSHVAFLKRAESSADFEGMESGIILVNEGQVSEREGDFSLPGEEVVGGWARVFRKGRKPTYRRLSIAQRKPSYDTPFWEGAKANEQIIKCAEADALRATFPSLLAGLHNEGEATNIDATIASAVETSTRELAGTVKALPEQENKTATTALTPQTELEAFCLAEGFTFDHFRQFAAKEQNLENAESFGSFAELPADLCKRMLRAKTGLKNTLMVIKEGQ